MPAKHATLLSLLQKVPTCSKVIHKTQKIKYLTIHGKAQECQLWFCLQCPSVRQLPSETTVQVGVLHQAGSLSQPGNF